MDLDTALCPGQLTQNKNIAEPRFGVEKGAQRPYGLPCWARSLQILTARVNFKLSLIARLIYAGWWEFPIKPFLRTRNHYNFVLLRTRDSRPSHQQPSLTLLFQNGTLRVSPEYSKSAVMM
jgi:hypothetical protein